MSLRSSLAWTYAAQAASFAITFAATIVVARVLSPRDFGVFAMANAVATIINVVFQFGLAKYIMRETNLSRDVLRTVFTVNLLLTVSYVGVIFVSALAAHSVVHSEEVSSFLLVFGLFPLIAMFEFVPAALCAREMRFRTIALITVLRAMVTSSFTIILALDGFGYMSFAWSQVASWVATAVCFNIILWRPDIWKPRLEGSKTILSFGTQMIGINGLSQLSTRAAEMALGSMLGLASLGIYTRASSLPSQFCNNIFGAGSNVFFSRFSEELRSTGSLHTSYGIFMRLILGLVWPMMFGLAVLSGPVIHVLYGEKWQEAAVPLALLTVAVAITIGIGLMSEVFILRRATGQQVKIEGFRAIFGFLVFTGGATFGLSIAAAGKVLEAVVAWLLYRSKMTKLIGGPANDIWSIYLEGVYLTTAAILPAGLLMVWSEWSSATSPALIAISIALGVILWGALLRARRHPIAVEASRLLRRCDPF